MAIKELNVIILQMFHDLLERGGIRIDISKHRQTLAYHGMFGKTAIKVMGTN